MSWPMLRREASNPSRRWFQFAEPERIAGLVSPERDVRFPGTRTEYIRISSPVSQPLHYCVP